MLCNQFFKSFEVLPDFVNAVEEEQLMAELTPKLKRMRYQFDHWDDVSTEFSLLTVHLANHSKFY